MKQLILLRGVSGSGKSTFAQILVETMVNAVAYSTDDFFMKESIYEFDVKKLNNAHNWCSTQVENALKGSDYQTIIVHNTSISNLEVNHYQKLAEKDNATFVSLVVENRHGRINTHGVERKKIERQALTLLNNIKVTDSFSYIAEKTKVKTAGQLEVISFLTPYIDNLDEGLRLLNENYLINSHRLNGKILLKYAEFANKSMTIVRECRGIILSEKDLSIVSIPFEKFGNYGESYAANDIDLSKSKIVEKLDGSCFILYFDHVNDKWCVQTLGQVEAEQTNTGWGKKIGMTWADLFWQTFSLYGKKAEILDLMDQNYSYVFELCTPYNRVVVEHKEPKLFFLGLRHKITLKEEDTKKSILSDIFDLPKEYKFNDLNEIVRVCKEELTSQEEGFIVVDENFNRIKLKSAEYVQKHYNSTVMTINSVCDVVFQNEQDEYLLSFPEFKGVVEVINSEIDRIGKSIDDMYTYIKQRMEDATSKKEFALRLKTYPESFEKSHLFNLFHGKYKNGKEAIMNYQTNESKNYKVKKFLDNSNIRQLINNHANTGSIK